MQIVRMQILGSDFEARARSRSETQAARRLILAGLIEQSELHQFIAQRGRVGEDYAMHALCAG